MRPCPCNVPLCNHWNEQGDKPCDVTSELNHDNFLVLTLEGGDYIRNCSSLIIVLMMDISEAVYLLLKYLKVTATVVWEEDETEIVSRLVYIIILF